MVKAVTSLTRNGVRDWLIQQLSSAFMAIYILGLAGYLIFHPVTDFYNWKNIFSHTPVRIATVLFFLLIILHTWAGIWTVATDYIKPAVLRMIFLLSVLFTLLACFIWSIQILWGI